MIFGGIEALPKQTFFNLPAKKRQTLLKAAKMEFTRAPLSDASIANIVKTAGIPRGSFYQYFENKEDLFLYLLNIKLEENREHFVHALKNHNGDLIEAMTEVYYNFLVKLPDEEEKNFLKNAFMYATHNVEYSLMKTFCSIEQLEEISDLIDKDSLNIQEDQDIIYILEIITGIAVHNFIRKISQKLTDDQAIEHFTAQIHLIKYGICKPDRNG